MLAERAPLDSGKALTFVPPTTLLRDLRYFEWHLHSRKCLESQLVDRGYETQGATVISTYLQEHSDRVVLFNGPTVPPGKEINLMKGGPVSDYRRTLQLRENNGIVAVTEVYRLARSGVSLGQLRVFVENSIDRRHLVCALSRVPTKVLDDASKSSELSDEICLLLVENVQEIIIGAYGGDARIFWFKEEAEANEWRYSRADSSFAPSGGD